MTALPLPEPEMPLGPCCVICVMLLGRRALPAITLIAGDPVCWDHVAHRVNRPLLTAIEVARGDLQAVRE